MRQFKTAAVILRTTDVFDADRSFLLFTREFGKLRARAKGVRRPTSRLGGHLLVALPTQLEIVESRGWYLITQAQLLNVTEGKPYPVDSLSFLGQAALLGETIDRLFIEMEPHQPIYDGMVYTLDKMRTLPTDKGSLLVLEFIFKCLIELGYHPQLKNCVLTKEPIQSNFLFWNSHLGGLISEKGMVQAQKEGFSGLGLQYSQTIVLLREMAKPQFRSEKLQITPEIQTEVKEVILDYLQSNIGKPLKSTQSLTK
jgi:DNA repair protein RecO (recombination protein O)